MRSQIFFDFRACFVRVSSQSSRIFKQSVDDYYLLRTTDAFQNFSNYGYVTVPYGRFELRSYIAREEDDIFASNHIFLHHTDKKALLQTPVRKALAVFSCIRNPNDNHYVPDIECYVRL